MQGFVVRALSELPAGFVFGGEALKFVMSKVGRRQ